MLLDGEVGGDACLFKPQLRHLDAGGQRTTAIDGLTGIGNELIAQMRRMQSVHLAEIAVSEQGVANETR